MNDNIRLLISNLQNELNEASIRFDYYVNHELPDVNAMNCELDRVINIEAKLAKLKQILEKSETDG